MTGELPQPRRRKRDAVLAVLVAIGVGSALPLQGSTYAAVVGHVILLVCLLVVLVRLHAAVWRGVRAQREEPLVAASRGSERSDTVPPELRRVMTDVVRTREHAGQYAKSLGPRLESLVERRVTLAGGRKIPLDGVPPEDTPRRSRRHGLTAVEIDQIVGAIEELCSPPSAGASARNA